MSREKIAVHNMRLEEFFCLDHVVDRPNTHRMGREWGE